VDSPQSSWLSLRSTLPVIPGRSMTTSDIGLRAARAGLQAPAEAALSMARPVAFRNALRSKLVLLIGIPPSGALHLGVAGVTGGKFTLGYCYQETIASNERC